MFKLPALPRKLMPIRHAAIEHALTGAPVPPDLHLLEGWLEIDGWDALLAAWDGEVVAMKLDELELNDRQVRECLDLGPRKRVTDDMRVQCAREMLERRREHDECFGVSVHPYPMRRRDGRSAILGCTVEIQGQAGAAAQWHGVFRTAEDFRNSLRRSGYWATDEADRLDTVILQQWERPKRLGKRKSRPS
jgi:hypothetical protein